MDLLNLDEILQTKRVIVLGGKEYALADQSVGQMITSIQLSEKVEGGQDPVGILEQMVKTVGEIIPDCPEKEIRALPMKALSAILEYANASNKEIAENATEEATDQASPDGKK